MMIARQLLGIAHAAQHAAYDGAQGFLHDLVIGNQAVGRFIDHAVLVNAPTPSVNPAVGTSSPNPGR